MSQHARNADAAYLRKREHERRRQTPVAPVGQYLGIYARDVTGGSDAHCDGCGYHVCSCPQPVGAMSRDGEVVCGHERCRGGYTCRDQAPNPYHAASLNKSAQWLPAVYARSQKDPMWWTHRRNVNNEWQVSMDGFNWVIL